MNNKEIKMMRKILRKFEELLIKVYFRTYETEYLDMLKNIMEIEKTI